MKIMPPLLAATLLAGLPLHAAEPVRIGVTTILSGPFADRGQSEQYGVELALAAINEAGGVLGRPVEAFYGDNAANVATGVRAVHRLIDEEHVPVLIGALATPVTHAIMPIVQEARVPLVIDVSLGQDFVDASGAGGNAWVFKTIPSDLDIARGMLGWLQPPARKVAIVADEGPLNRVFATSFARAAKEAGIDVVSDETVPKNTGDLAPLLERLKALGPDHVITLLGPSTGPFFRAYEQSGWRVPVDGRVDLAGAIAAVSPGFVAQGGLAQVAGISVFTPMQDSPAVQSFVAGYRSHYGLMPTQRAFFAYEAAYLVVDAIRRAGSDRPADIAAALRTTTMPSGLGGSYAMDDHNHAHTPMQIIGVRDGKAAVIDVTGRH